VPEPAELLEVALAAADAGGAKLMEGLERKDKGVTLKSERSSIVTWADEASQEAVFEVITREYPGHRIMGEEGDGGTVDGPYTWIVDPLDGTTNYSMGIPFWAISVAVRASDGPVLAGVIANPSTGEHFAGCRGGGVEFAPTDTAELSRATIGTGLQNDDPAIINEYVRRYERLILNCRGVRGLGSPAMTLAYVAAGRLDAFVEKDATYAWDIAAGLLLLEEAGGTLTDFDGGPPNLGRGIANVIASNGHIHDALVDVCAEPG
jgi:myo-inositol-1(or 4)-monophosphatase